MYEISDARRPVDVDQQQQDGRDDRGQRGRPETVSSAAVVQQRVLELFADLFSVHSHAVIAVSVRHAILGPDVQVIVTAGLVPFLRRADLQLNYNPYATIIIRADYIRY